MTTLRNHLIINFAQSYLILIVQFITSLIIARLLTPAELGIFSIAAVIVAIGNSVRDFGVIDYIVQEAQLTPTRIKAAIGITAIGAWSISLLLVLLSVPIAQFYNEEALSDLLLLFALNFLLLPFGSVILAYLKREMRFYLLAKVNLFTAIVQSVTAIVLAYQGFSYFSLVWSSVITNILTVAIAQYLRPKGFPILGGIRELKHVFKFGSFSTMNTIMQDLQKGTPDLILGRTIGVEAVAFFGRAVGMVEIINKIIVQSVTNVFLPHFSARNRDGLSMQEMFLRSTSNLSIVLWPCFLVVGLAAEPLIVTLYGHQWEQSIPLVVLLVFGEILVAPFSLQRELFISVGLIRVEFFRSVFNVAMRTVPLLLLSPYGLFAVVEGYVATYLLTAMISVWLLRRYFNITFPDIVKSLSNSLIILFLLIFVSFFAREMLSGYLNGHWAEIFIYGFIVFGFWITLLFGLKHAFWFELTNVLHDLRCRLRKT